MDKIAKKAFQIIKLDEDANFGDEYIQIWVYSCIIIHVAPSFQSLWLMLLS